MHAEDNAAVADARAALALAGASSALCRCCAWLRFVSNVLRLRCVCAQAVHVCCTCTCIHRVDVSPAAALLLLVWRMC
jgi:hypothetical protein